MSSNVLDYLERSRAALADKWAVIDEKERLTYEELYTCIRAIEHEQGITVRVAYNLDGGYSSAMVLHNEKINWPENGVNREVSDIVYFASAWQKE